MQSLKKQFYQLTMRLLIGLPVFLFFFLFIFSSDFCQSQSLVLHNVNNGLSRNIINTKDVTIITIDQAAEKIKGALFIVNDSTIRSDSLEIPLADIASIKVITNKSKMWGYIFAGAGAVFLGAGILLLARTSGDAGFHQLGNTIVGVQFILQGAAAAIPAIRFLFYGKTYRKSAGWELQIQRTS